MKYSVSLNSKAKKDFLALDGSVRKQILIKLNKLGKDPFSLRIKKLKTPFDGYRIRSGDYRLLFTIEKKEITTYSIKHRKDAYKM